MSAPDPDDVALAVRLVREAGSLAHRMRQRGVDVEEKTSGSDVVTDADHAAEALVVEELTAARPDDGILGEEGASATGSSGRTWVIDPVDGTFNFTRGWDWWCSAIALTAGDPDGAVGPGDPDSTAGLLLGAVHHPASGRTWVGGPGLPTTLDGEPLPPLAPVPAARRCATTYLHPPFRDEIVSEAFARAASCVGTVRMLGSGTMDSTLVTEGRADVLFQHSVHPWDRLPGAALSLGVGGHSVMVPAGGVRWTVTGEAHAVTEIAAALTS